MGAGADSFTPAFEPEAIPIIAAVMRVIPAKAGIQ